MSRVVCRYCGLPFKAARAVPGREYFCCSGCALASRVPVGADGGFPVNATLLTALAVGFVMFNQLLFWLLAGLLVREGRVEASVRFTVGSMVLGGAAWGAMLIVQWRLGARRLRDTGMALITAGLLADGFAAGSPAWAVAADAVLAAWSLRGFLRGKNSRETA